MSQTNKNVPKMFKGRQKEPSRTIISFPSDRAGCGFYRTIIPFNYLVSEKEYDCPFLYNFNFDINFLARADWLRFQRNSTASHKAIIAEYRRMLAKATSKCKIAYELDDLLHEVEPYNILAYQYYTEARKKNAIELMKMSDMVTFSTQFLQDYYEDRHGITNSTVIPNYLPRYLWGHCGKRDKYRKSKEGKLRILWSGSASHIAKGGDFDFLIPLIEKTIDEFEWVFLGVCPPTLLGKVEFADWQDFYAFPNALDAIDADVFIAPIKDTIFNYGKSDLKLLEASAIGLPCLCSATKDGIGPYDLVPNALTVENKVDSWYDVLKQLEKDETMWQAALDAGRAELANRWLEDNTKLYVDTFTKNS